MKGLLHSKKFKWNLYRWLFMYVGVLGLLTTVITYSKYMKKLVEYNDDVRPAVFEADINYIDASGEPCLENVCNIGTYRPTSTIKYYFKVNTKFEVLADLYVTARIAKDYQDFFEIVDIKVKDTSTPLTNVSTIPTDKSRYMILVRNTLQEDADGNEGAAPFEESYEVTVKVKDGVKIDLSEFSTLQTVVEVGYTATQRTS